MNDPIADMLIRIKNSGSAGNRTTSFSYSKMKLAIAKLLENEGFINNVTTKGKKNNPREIEVDVAYVGNKPKMKGAERVSKFSRRVYKKAADIKPSTTKLGFSVVTTSQGVMTDKQAKDKKVGGEVLFRIW